MLPTLFKVLHRVQVRDLVHKFMQSGFPTNHSCSTVSANVVDHVCIPANLVTIGNIGRPMEK